MVSDQQKKRTLMVSDQEKYALFDNQAQDVSASASAKLKRRAALPSK